MKPNETHPIIIAIMQAPKRTKCEREQVTMLLAPYTPFEEIIECLLGEPMDRGPVLSLLGPEAREARRVYGVSSDRIEYAVEVANILEHIAGDLKDIDPMYEFSLHDLGVVLQRVPRVVTENSLFSFMQDYERVTETFEEFLSAGNAWIWDRLQQDYEAQGSYLPVIGDYTLLEFMNLYLWERGVWEMGNRLNLDGFGIQTYKDGAWLW